jgi:hypothetical protein
VKAWLADAAIMGVAFAGLSIAFSGRDIGWSILGGALFGALMASLAAWRGMGTVGRRRFGRPS